ncbi:hypothetical protein [Sinorhizobium meliloti]|uniref:hypothetical protein n=2 Tax=Rhizobium meliloti TaxID=382 RepID=UPI001F284E3F|nr:hypothetical protein [Sinorhizobium meliloti]
MAPTSPAHSQATSLSNPGRATVPLAERPRSSSMGSEDGTKGLTENGIDDLRDLLADIRTWDGGIRQFLVDEQCDLEMIERVMADEVKRVL